MVTSEVLPQIRQTGGYIPIKDSDGRQLSVDEILKCADAIVSKWAPPHENNTKAYIANVSKLTGIGPDEPIGIPSDKPARWLAVGAAMAIQENGTNAVDYFAMLRGWTLCRGDC